MKGSWHAITMTLPTEARPATATPFLPLPPFADDTPRFSDATRRSLAEARYGAQQIIGFLPASDISPALRCMSPRPCFADGA